MTEQQKESMKQEMSNLDLAGIVNKKKSLMKDLEKGLAVFQASIMKKSERAKAIKMLDKIKEQSEMLSVLDELQEKQDF